MYPYRQASAKPVDHRLIRCRGTHHFDVADVSENEEIKELSQRWCITAHLIRRVDCDPTTRPWRKIKRTNHERSVPGGRRTLRRVASPSHRYQEPHALLIRPSIASEEDNDPALFHAAIYWK